MPRPAWETLCLLAPLTTYPGAHLPSLFCEYLHPLSRCRGNPIPGAVQPPRNIEALGVLNMLEGRSPRSISEVEGVSVTPQSEAAPFPGGWALAASDLRPFPAAWEPL